MLNTPAKTPSRKRKDVNGTARLLFGDNEGLLEPTPSRTRRARMDPFGIFNDEEATRASGGGIQIYTDSKERVPSLDEDEANPFLSRNAGRTGGKAKSRRKSAQEKQMEEAIRNDEGMVYVL